MQFGRVRRNRPQPIPAQGRLKAKVRSLTTSARRRKRNLTTDCADDTDQGLKSKDGQRGSKICPRNKRNTRKGEQVKSRMLTDSQKPAKQAKVAKGKERLDRIYRMGVEMND